MARHGWSAPTGLPLNPALDGGAFWKAWAREKRLALDLPALPLRTGYWGVSGVPHPADPRACVDESWDPRERELVVAWLKRGTVLHQWRGHHTCLLWAPCACCCLFH